MDEIRPKVGVFELARARFSDSLGSEFRRNVLWTALLGGFERGVAVVQAVLIARALGITEYGAFGLLLGTIGYVASVVGFQMALTAAVFVSRYRHNEKPKAAAVISAVRRFSWSIVVTFVVLMLPFSRLLSEVLLGSAHYHLAVALGVAFVGVSVLSDVQDGLAQGFEIFETLARIKAVSAVLVLASIYPASAWFGLNGALASIALAPVLKYVLLQAAIVRCSTRDELPQAGSGVSLMSLLRDFALPSMVVCLLVGLPTWVGLLLLSRLAAGFDQVAIVATGLQWRTPVLLLTTAVGSVAVPAFSRMSSLGDATGARGFRRRLLAVNFAVSSVAALLTIAGSGVILALYGPDFASGRVAFCAIALSTVPTSLANVYMQELIGAARMWRQLWLHGAYIVALCGSFVVLVPRYHALGYAASLLIGAVVFLAQAVLADRPAGLGAGGRTAS